MTPIVLEISTDKEDQRLDQVLLETLRLPPYSAEISRQTLKKWFKGGLVILNDRISKPSFILPLGKHTITLNVHDFRKKPAAAASTDKAKVKIIHEDDDLLILNKPERMYTLPHRAEETSTAVGAALAICPSIKDVGKGGLEPGLLHRLDTGTSGIIVFAKNQTEFDRLREIWKTDKIRKFYRAVVSSPQKENQNITLPLAIDYKLARSSKSAKKMLVMTDKKNERFFTTNSRGPLLSAKTIILNLKIIPDQDELLDLAIEITTGVMHQIRAHLAEIGYPILGDTLYGKTPSSRLWLHAWKLVIETKFGKTLTFTADLPENWPDQLQPMLLPQFKHL